MKRSVLLVALLALTGLIATGAPVCVPGNLQDYIDLGSGGCSIGNAQFFDFVDLGPLGGATGLSPDAIGVAPLFEQFNPGFEFSVGAAAGAGVFLESRFGYTLQTTGALVQGASLAMTGSAVAPDGVTTVVEDFCQGDAFIIDFCPVGTDTLIVFDIGSDQETAAKLSFPGVSTLGLIKDIGVDGGLAGSATISTAINRFALVPEPATGLMAGLGLLALTCLGVRHRRTGRRQSGGGVR